MTRWLNELPAGGAVRARWGGGALRGLGLLLLVIALSGPRWPDSGGRLNAEGIAIMLAVDVSGSMAERDFPWGRERIARLEAVKRAAGMFVHGGDGPAGEHLEGRHEDLIGYIPFAARPETGCPLTLSHSTLLKMLEAEEPRSLPTESETNIGDALAWCLTRLEAAGNRRRVLVLLSDGEHNVGPPALKPRQAAQLAAQMHVPVYAVHAGVDPKDAADKEAGEGEQTLKSVAALTGGRYFRAHDVHALLDVCGEIDRLERQPIESFQYRRFLELYPWFGLAALVVFVGVSFLEMTIWQRIP
jgi:Ca-activated chloride channel family protein